MVCSTQPVPMCPLPLPSSPNARHLATPAHHHPFQKPPTLDFPRLPGHVPPSITASYSAQTLCLFLLLQEEVRHGAILVVTRQRTRYPVGVPTVCRWQGNCSIRVSLLVHIPLLGKEKALITAGLGRGVGVGVLQIQTTKTGSRPSVRLVMVA